MQDGLIRKKQLYPNLSKNLRSSLLDAQVNNKLPSQQNLRKETNLDNVSNNPSRRDNNTHAITVTPTMGPPTAPKFGATGIRNMVVAPVELQPLLKRLQLKLVLQLLVHFLPKTQLLQPLLVQVVMLQPKIPTMLTITIAMIIKPQKGKHKEYQKDSIT